MFGMLEGLAKATVAVALTPVAVVADVVTLPASADDPRRGPFDRTANMLETAGDNIKEALQPKRD